LVQRNRREGRLRFSQDLALAVRSARIVFIAVGTPQAADGAADLTNLWSVVDAIADANVGQPAAPDRLLVVKSTVPVGTNRAIADRLASRSAGGGWEIASNPEFLKEGAAVDDFMRPDRVVVGVRRPEVGELLHELYAP